MNRPSFARLAACSLVAISGIAVAAAPAGAGPWPQNRRDPFEKNGVPRVAPPKPIETVIAPPPIEQRREQCRSKRTSDQPIDSMPCMYLVSEMSLNGVFRTQDAPEAFLFARPTSEVVTVRVGDQLFDGRVVAIHEPGPDVPGSIVLEKVVQKRVGKSFKTIAETVALTMR